MEERAYSKRLSAALRGSLLLSLTALLVYSVAPDQIVAQTNPAVVPERVVVSISPSYAALPTEGSQQFTATVRGTSNEAVLWLVSGVIGGNSTVGTISATGFFTAPATRPTSRVSVSAISLADPSKSASPLVTIGGPSGTKVWRYGATADAIMSNTPGVVDALSHQRRRMTTRLVYDPGIPASQYLPFAQQVYAVSDIMGQSIDSSEVKNKYNVTTYLQRFQDDVPAMENITAQWELCNECNGEWLGKISTVAQEATETYDYLVSQGDQAKTVLTLLYNETCYSNVNNMIWNWVQTLPSRVIDGVNTVVLSYWKDQCNGLDRDWQQVMTHLSAVFPNSWVGIGECGVLHYSYWEQC